MLALLVGELWTSVNWVIDFSFFNFFICFPPAM